MILTEVKLPGGMSTKNHVFSLQKYIYSRHDAPLKEVLYIVRSREVSQRREWIAPASVILLVSIRKELLSQRAILILLGPFRYS